MSENRSEFSEKRWPMTCTQVDAPQGAVRGWLETIAGQRRPTESIKAMLRRIARAAGLPPARIKALWYGEARRIDWAEGEALRQSAELIAAKRRERIEDNDLQIQRTRDEIAEIEDRRRSRRNALVDVEAPHCGGKFLFWLGQEAPGLD